LEVSKTASTWTNHKAGFVDQKSVSLTATALTGTAAAAEASSPAITITRKAGSPMWQPGRGRLILIMYFRYDAVI